MSIALLMAQPYVVHADAMEAIELIARLGEAAAEEAAMRALKARDTGNFLGFCRWRQIQRLIALLDSDETLDTVH